jgi:DNA-binding protein Fis
MVFVNKQRITAECIASSKKELSTYKLETKEIKQIYNLVINKMENV